VDDPVAGRLPDNSEKAARFARDDMMRRMGDHGMDHAEIAEIVGLDERTAPIKTLALAYRRSQKA